VHKASGRGCAANIEQDFSIEKSGKPMGRESANAGPDIAIAAATNVDLITTTLLAKLSSGRAKTHLKNLPSPLAYGQDAGNRDAQCARGAQPGAGTNDTNVTKELPLRSQLFGYIQRYSITKYHSLLIVFESYPSSQPRASGASPVLAINGASYHSPLLGFYAAVMFCRSSPLVVDRFAPGGGPKQV
jgi:hypothetical protein